MSEPDYEATLHDAGLACVYSGHRCNSGRCVYHRTLVVLRAVYRAGRDDERREIVALLWDCLGSLRPRHRATPVIRSVIDAIETRKGGDHGRA